MSNNETNLNVTGEEAKEGEDQEDVEEAEKEYEKAQEEYSEMKMQEIKRKRPKLNGKNVSFLAKTKQTKKASL
jgi:hypothetical protein